MSVLGRGGQRGGCGRNTGLGSSGERHKAFKGAAAGLPVGGAKGRENQVHRWPSYKIECFFKKKKKDKKQNQQNEWVVCFQNIRNFVYMELGVVVKSKTMAP